MSKRINPTNKTNVVENSRTVKETPKVQREFFSFWKQYPYVALIFAILGFGLYHYALKCEYVLDDQIVYTDNKFTKQGLAGIGDILKKETFVGYFGEQKDLVTGARYRPLSLVSFAIEQEFFKEPVYTDDTKTKMKKDKHGTDLFLAPAWVGHFNNILLYVLSTLLLFRVLSMLFPIKEDEKWFFNLPFIASLLFLLHPIHTEAVANIKGRDEILAFIGAFGTLYYVLKWKDSKSTLDMLLALVVFFLGLLAKENALTFLAIIPLTLYFFTDATIAQLKKSTIYLLLTFVFYFLIRYSVIGYVLGTGKEITDILNNPFYGMTTGERFATVFYTLLHYIKLLFIPIQLTHDYYPYQIPIMNWGKWESILSLAVYVGMAAFAVWGLRTKNFYAYCAAFYLATLSIVSNIPFSVGTFMNERFVYLSSVALVMLLAYWTTRVFPKWIPGNVANINIVGAILAGALSLGYAWKTQDRVPAWENAMSLNSSSIKVSPNSARANLFMGTALFNNSKIKPKEDSSRKEMMYRARHYVRKAVKIVPTYYSAIHMLSGLDAEIFYYEPNIDSLLTNFETYMKVRDRLNVERKQDNAVYMDLYLEFLNGQPQYAPRLVTFYKNILPSFIEKKDHANANRYLQYALYHAPKDPWLNEQVNKVIALQPKQQQGQLQQPQQQLLQKPLTK